MKMIILILIISYSVPSVAHEIPEDKVELRNETLFINNQKYWTPEIDSVSRWEVYNLKKVGTTFFTFKLELTNGSTLAMIANVETKQATEDK